MHDFGGPIGLPLALAERSGVTRIAIMNTWLWPFDDDREMVRRARIAGGAFGAWMYRHLNFSLRVLTPSAYGDRSKLTPEIHRHYLEPFRDKDARLRADTSLLLPEAEVVMLANDGHWPQEEGPETVVEAMRRFLHRTATPLSVA